MSTFAARLFDAIQKNESVYDAFFDICIKELPADTDIRYQWLRNNGYVARDEDDINVYVVKVAAKHKPKFKWLYDNLFDKFPQIFQNEIDLVVWGCGCGLDLLALYDRAMKQNNPQLWLTVRSITLLDKSESALQRAKEIAEMLFPLAKGKIVICMCDFTSQAQIKVRIPLSFLYTPRIHLVSNLIDLLSEEQLTRFVQSQKRICARSMYGQCGFNDIFVTFSPEYRNWDWVSTCLKMKCYRDAWGTNASDIETREDKPALCAYATFALNSLRGSPPYKAYAQNNTCLRNLVKCRNKCLDEGCDDKELKGLHKALYKITIGDKKFFDCYEWVDIQAWEDNRGEKHIDRLLFVPRGNSNVVACVIYFNKPQTDIDIRKKAWEGVFKKHGLENLDAACFASCTKHLLWRNGIFAGDVDFDKWDLNQPFAFSEAFVINPRGAKPLPYIDREMDKKQKDVIFGRAQLRRIRGGAGCGKTTTMLWHGVVSILRTHQPVLMACRTVTLFNHNQRRMAATMLSTINGLEYVERDLILFQTIDKYLCGHISGLGKCGIRNCGECKRRFFKSYNRNPNLPLDSSIPKTCKDGAPSLPNCEVLMNWEDSPENVGRNLAEKEKELLCANCKKESIKALCNKKAEYISGVDNIGAVMVDEIQSIEPDKVQALYNLTESGNPNREFYCFCDERQCLKTESLESDANANGKMRVRTPSTGGERRFNSKWITMTRPYRQMGDMSGMLTEISLRLQKLLNSKYGDNECESRVFQPELANVFSVEQCDNNLLMEAVDRNIIRLCGLGEKRITVICEKPQTVRKLLQVECNHPWRSTHAVKESFRKEQLLRSNFEESEDHVGLTTIDLAQGWDLESVILIVENDKVSNPHEIESIITGATRARRQLRIVDISSTHWVYELLKGYN